MWKKKGGESIFHDIGLLQNCSAKGFYYHVIIISQYRHRLPKSLLFGKWLHALYFWKAKETTSLVHMYQKSWIKTVMREVLNLFDSNFNKPRYEYPDERKE